MKSYLPFVFAIVFAGVIAAGCLGGNNTAGTPVPSLLTTPVVTPVQKPSFTLGDIYLEKKYSFQSEKDVIIEPFRVANPSWGIEFHVHPLVDEPQYTWFEMKVTNMDRNQTDIYGYGRTNSFEKEQLIPMYNQGPYQVEMSGNRVMVEVKIAKRNP